MNQNPIQAAIQMLNMGKDPMGALQKMAGVNPQMAQAMHMISGKTPQQLQTMAQNMANERGINLESFIKELGISPHIKR